MDEVRPCMTVTSPPTHTRRRYFQAGVTRSGFHDVSQLQNACR